MSSQKQMAIRIQRFFERDPWVVAIDGVIIVFTAAEADGTTATWFRPLLRR